MVSRRKFLAQSMLTMAGLPWFLSRPFSPLNVNNIYVDEIGLQLYTVRQLMAEDPDATLQAIKEAGYHQVEVGDVRTLATLFPKIQNAGLIVQSSFFPGAFITERWDLVEAGGGQKPAAGYTIESLIEEAVNHDIKYLVFGYLRPEERQQIEDYQQYADRLNKMGEQCNQADIHLCYHNHSFEFKPINGVVPFEVLMEALDKEMVHFELDVFWASIGGNDPVALLERLNSRVKLLHLKDIRKGTPVQFNEGRVKKKAFQELGDGMLDIPQILKVAEKTSVEWCFVEQDQSPNPLASIRQSIQYLQDIKPQL